VNGLTLLALIALAIVAYVAYRAGILAGRREGRGYAPPFASSTSPALPAEVAPPAAARPAPLPASEPLTPARAATATDAAEPPQPAAHDAELIQLRAFAEERRALFAALADARADVARYRQIVVDIENNAPPPLLASPNAPDDLKLIVGVGPVLERMLQQLGIATYRQIARWTERDIDEFDARLPEFHGRIRRDDWVTQARELHLSKYGERP
jgi:predicted flap endonuclease-1-like 5' DNA nuclease